MNLLFLDDSAHRIESFMEYAKGHEVFVATDAAAAIRWLNSGVQFDMVFLDHDLEDDHYRRYLETQDYVAQERTGMDVVKHLALMPEEKRPKVVVVHTHNPPAGERMRQELRAIPGLTTVRCWFGPTIGVVLNQTQLVFGKEIG